MYIYGLPISKTRRPNLKFDCKLKFLSSFYQANEIQFTSNKLKSNQLKRTINKLQ